MSGELVDRAEALLDAALGGRPDHVVWSPGRVNVIGEHTDYNDGFALPAAIDRGLVLAARTRDDGRIRLVSDLDDQVHEVEPRGLGRSADAPRWPSWTEYAQGVLREWWPDRRDVGLDLAVVSDLPAGAGLSSSAALELGVGRVAAAVDGRDWDPAAAAEIGRIAENDWVGVSTGIMDQLAVAHGRDGHALLLDCADGSTRTVALPTGLELLVLDTGVRRSLVGSAYDDRRAACEAAAAALGVASLREVDDVDALVDLPPRLQARSRHVVTENARVHAFAAALEAGDLDAAGAAMRRSHASLRDDYEVTCPELDTMAEVANDTAGVVGARMTGGGFGGAVVALADAGAVDLDAVIRRYGEHHDEQARAMAVRPADGTALLRTGSGG